jgi:hypothetical protein
MFKVFDQNFLYSDRQRFFVNKIIKKTVFTESDYTRYILCDGKISSSSINIQGTFVASLNDEFEIEGNGLVIDLFGFKFNEQSLTIVKSDVPGNLSYIDGCSNSTVITPPRNGDPCLNYLYFPDDINQSFHLHPSVRIGMILSGNGVAETKNKTYPLNPGTTFILDRMCLHRFKTDNSHMSLFAFHPDSDDGPKDETNPMISRTYISK